MPDDWQLVDGDVTLRRFRSEDAPVLIAGRDEEWRRWLGPGHDEPHPTACIVVDGQIVGWVDADPDPPRLGDAEVNLGFNVFEPYRRRGYATKAVRLMLNHLKSEGRYRTARMSIDPRNHASLAVAAKAGFRRTAETDDAYLFALPIPSA